MSALFIMVVVNLMLGALLGAAGMYGVQVWLSRQRVEAASPATPDNAPSTAQAPESPSQQQASWLTALMQKVEGDLNRHAFEVDEIAQELGDTSPDDPEAILAAAATMLVANRRLQADLAMSQQEVEQQRRKADALAAESRTDALTGLPNRRSFDEELLRRIDQWRRHKVPVSLLLVDIDRFKQINDRYGHPVGDAALKWVAGLQASSLRQMDLAARYGGEEFAVILPGIKLSDASNVAERLRGTIAAKKFQEGEHEFPVTVSIGVAMTVSEDQPAALIKRADEALYAAKHNGRNCAFLHDGGAAMQIKPDQNLVRHAFDTLQQVAKYGGGTGIPPPSAFVAMRASDISAKGISFVCDSPPDCQAFVVRLGVGEKARYMVANIANVTALSQDEPVQYRVGCAFVARLEADDAAEAAEERDLVAC
ncbi:MAG TPA: GGDEF domain-containing protein [Pirellulales bacterium]|nr:GGDEF domain-containing protein [Pirellulales bacterium]